MTKKTQFPQPKLTLRQLSDQLLLDDMLSLSNFYVNIITFWKIVIKARQARKARKLKIKARQNRGTFCKKRDTN